MLAPFLTQRARGLQRRRRGGLGARRAARRGRRGDAARGRAATVCSGIVKVASLETLYLRRRLASVDLPQGDDRRRARRLGRDHRLARLAARARRDRRGSRAARRRPRPAPGRGDLLGSLPRDTRQSPGSVIAKALAGIENALLDLKAKALGVPVYELFGGPTRESIPMYWSHCGTTRARAFEVTGTPKLASYDDVAALGREVVDARLRARSRRTSSCPATSRRCSCPGSTKAAARCAPSEIADALVRLLEAFAEGTGGARAPIVDLNFNLEPEGCVRVAKALEPFDLLWLEVDLFDPAALAHVRHVAPMPICSGENLYGEPRLPPVPRGGRDGRRVGRRDLERLPPGEEDRRPRRDVRGQLRAAQLLLAPRDLHLGAVVRGDPERAHPRVRRRRRALARRARHRRCPRSRPASCGSRPGRAGASS